MDKLRFVFSETLMALGLAFLGLVAAKAVGGLQAAGSPKDSNRGLAVIRGILYTAILVLVILGARGLGTGVSAEVRALASLNDRDQLAGPKLSERSASGAIATGRSGLLEHLVRG